MSRKCKVSGKGPLVGYNVSHAHNKTKMRQLPNLQWKRIFDEERGCFVRIRASARALRAISRVGLNAYLRSSGVTVQDLT